MVKRGSLIASGRSNELGSGKEKRELLILGRGLKSNHTDQIQKQKGVESAQLVDRTLSIVHSDEFESSHTIELLVSAGVEVEEVTREKDSLEDVFLALTGESS